MKKVEKEHVVKKLNNVKLVFGNGFDLFCGIATTYSDFFSYNKEKYCAIGLWIDELKFQEKYRHYLNTEIHNYEDFYPKTKLDSDVTLWDIFFVLKSPCIDENILWCQVEEEIKFSFISKNINDGNHINWNDIYRFMSGEFTTFIDDLTVNEALCLCYIKKHFKEIFAYETYIQYLLSELKRFERKFGKYIQSQIARPFYKGNALLTITKFVNLKRTLFTIDTFNYSTIDEKELIMNNINGNYREPIFGIDNINGVIDDSYCFTKNYRRMEQQFANGQIYVDEPFENIIIFGHSLNEADYNYFFPLFDKLKICDPDFDGKIVFAYSIYAPEKREEIKRKLLLSVTKLFNKYEEYSKNKNENRLLEMLNFRRNIIYYQVNDKDLTFE